MRWKLVLTFILSLSQLSGFCQSQSSKKTRAAKVPPAENEWALHGRLAANPHDEAAHKRLCTLLEKRRDYRRLVEERKAWLKDNPENWFELISLTTEAQFSLNDPQYGIDVSRWYLGQIKPGDEMYGWANYFLAKQLSARGRYEEALPLLERARQAAPDNEDYLSELGAVLVNSGQTKAGVETLKHAVTLCQSCTRLHTRLGDAFGVAKDDQEQETEYKAAVALDNKNAQQYLTLARLQVQHGELEDAEKNIDDAIRNDPMALDGYLLRARIHERKGNALAAARERERANMLLATEMKKEKAKSIMDTVVPLIVFIYDDHEESARLLEAARPKLTTLDRRLLAGVYFDQGRPDEGLKLYEETFFDTKLNNAQGHFLLAEALRKAGRNAKAEEHYRKAYEMDPANVTYRYELEAIQQSKASSR